MQETLQVRIKRLDEKAQLPKKAHTHDAGLDLFALDDGKPYIDPKGASITYRTGIALEIPDGYVGLIFPRSSIVDKTSLSLSNSVGVIDSNYRGEILFKFRDVSAGFSRWRYKAGDRIGQLIVIPYPNIEFQEVTELSSTDRNQDGFGSSGA